MKGNSHLDLTSLIQRMLMQRYKIQILINRLKKGSVFFFFSFVCLLFLYYAFNSFLDVPRVGNAVTSREPSRCYLSMKQKHFVLNTVRIDAKKLLEMPSSSLPVW